MGEIEQALIPGLPDDIAWDCLARVPQQFHCCLRPVCHRWKDLVTTPAFRRQRMRIGAAEDLIFMVQALPPVEPSNIEHACDDDYAGEAKNSNKSTAAPNCRPPTYVLGLYNVTDNSWHRIAASGGDLVPMFAQCAVVDNKLVLVGGWDPVTFDPVADVRVLDLSTGEWRRGAPMAAARSFFACAAVDGRVYVAGGHDGQKNALRSAEVYDVTADQWAALPPLAEERDECRGMAAAGGRFWAVSGYKTESQGLFDSSAECFDPAKNEWNKEEGFLGSAAPSAATAVVSIGERIWSVGREVREYEGKEWRTVAVVPEGMTSSPCTAVMGGGERVFVMGAEGSGGYGAWVMEVGSKKWAPVYTPPGFSGFVYSAAAVRL